MKRFEREWSRTIQLKTRKRRGSCTASDMDHDPGGATCDQARDLQDDQIRHLVALLEVAKNLTSALESHDVVHQVLTRAIAIIPAADAGTLYLADSISGRLVATDSVGFGPSIFKLSLEPGEAAAGRAFISGRGAIYPDSTTVHAIVAAATPETIHYFQEASQGMRFPKAAMAAPLIFKGTLIGAMVVDAVQNEGTFSGADLLMLQEFAQIAAIAIENARLYSLERTGRVRLEVLKDEIAHQHDEISRRMAAQVSLSQLAREDFGLDALARRLADLTGARRTCILDCLGRFKVQEPAPAQNDHQVEPLHGEQCADLIRRVSDDRRPHAIIMHDAQLVVSPILGSGEVLGYVLVEVAKPLPLGGLESLMETAALVASVIFARERALDDGVAYRQSELLEKLLDGELPRSAASFRMLPPPIRLAVGKLRRVATARDGRSAEANVLREVLIAAAQVLKGQATPMASTTRDGHVVLAWSAARREGKSGVVEKLNAIASKILASTGFRVRFALSSLIEDPQLVSQFYQEARLAVELKPWTDSAVVEAEFLGAYRLIVGAASSRQIAEFSRQTFARVIAHDQKRRSQLLVTLRTYLASGSSVSLSARSLKIHVHTVQYRLSKIEELTRLHFQNAEERLTMELGLRILELAEPQLMLS